MVLDHQFQNEIPCADFYKKKLQKIDKRISNEWFTARNICDDIWHSPQPHEIFSGANKIWFTLMIVHVYV